MATVVLSGCTGKQEQTTDAPAVEVMHWLSAGRDAAALAVLRDSFTARGGVWRDAPMPAGGGTGRAAVINRMVGGQPPAVFQFSMGSQLLELAEQGLVATVPPSAQRNAALSPLIASITKHNGQDIAIPITIRGENWMFYNVAVLRQAGVEVPRTWEELLSIAPKIKAQGITPIALGGQPWQERLLFNAVLLGVGGRDFYRRVYEQLDTAAIGSATMREVFRTFGALRQHVDAGSPGRRWNQATIMLVQRKAAFQFMGDWAKGEMLEAGVELGRDIGCALAPAPEQSYIMMVDAFAFSPSKDPNVASGQRLFARTLRDHDVQVAMAQQSGAIPVQAGIPDAGFDPCSVLALSVARHHQAQLLDPGLSLPGGLSGAIDDSISRIWNDATLTPASAHEIFARTIEEGSGLGARARNRQETS